KGDIFGQPIFKDTDVGQSAASVRALTYCDLQCIKRDKLIDILKFYSQFAVSFSRTLVLSYNLRNRVSSFLSFIYAYFVVCINHIYDYHDLKSSE
ncbi:unnamed protein product, partial [Schistosoma curassoni]|uniref:Cyclic nucleotide-binding domain-containing protein n=1 Tax=Schistosoma curassoni TaxID=6186 RepID=A0A183JTN1_9TREM